MSALWAAILNETMPLGEEITMAEIFSTLRRSQKFQSCKIRRLNDMTPILRWARDVEGGVIFERRHYNGYSRWTRTREIQPPPETQARRARMTIIKHDIPTGSSAFSRPNPVTVSAPPWEAAQ